MPRAVVQRETVKRELKSVEEGWVELIQLPYYEMLKRRDNAMKMSMELNPNLGDEDIRRLDLGFANEWTTQFDFANCIADHNLTDDQDKKLDFKNELVFQILDPRVGLEIEKLITELNQEEARKQEDFTPAPSSSSTDSPQTPNDDTVET